MHYIVCCCFIIYCVAISLSYCVAISLYSVDLSLYIDLFYDIISCSFVIFCVAVALCSIPDQLYNRRETQYTIKQKHNAL